MIQCQPVCSGKQRMVYRGLWEQIILLENVCLIQLLKEGSGSDTHAKLPTEKGLLTSHSFRKLRREINSCPCLEVLRHKPQFSLGTSRKFIPCSHQTKIIPSFISIFQCYAFTLPNRLHTVFLKLFPLRYKDYLRF